MAPEATTSTQKSSFELPALPRSDLSSVEFGGDDGALLAAESRKETRDGLRAGHEKSRASWENA